MPKAFHDKMSPGFQPRSQAQHQGDPQELLSDFCFNLKIKILIYDRLDCSILCRDVSDIKIVKICGAALSLECNISLPKSECIDRKIFESR